MKCELKYIYHTQKKMIKNVSLKNELRHRKFCVLFGLLLVVIGHITNWISSILLFILLFICLYYEAHNWCKTKKSLKGV